MTGKLNFLGWNCRGTTGKDKINRIRRITMENHIDILALVETRANGDRVVRFCNHFARNWNWVAIPADGYSGGIIILWRKQIGKISPVVHSRRALHLIFSSSADHPWIISVVYNAHHIKLQKKLWKELTSITKLRLPWIVLGDFNAITSSSEHKDSNFYYYARKAFFFSKFISTNALVDASYSGASFFLV